MSERVTMPALGESVTEGTVTRWLKSVGDTVEVDEPLLEVSTDKVDTEIPSPVAGTLQEILAEEDETVEVGAELCVIGEGEAPSGDGDGPEQAEQEEEPEPQQEQQPEPEPEQEEQPEPEPQQEEPSGAPSGGGDSGGETVTMPALGESVTEGTVTRWLKSEGDTVEVDEPLLEVSTDKVDTEIPSPVAGVLTRILAQEDETVEVGGELAVVGGEPSGDGGGAADEAKDEQAETAGATEEASQQPETEDTGTEQAREAADTQEQPEQEQRGGGDLAEDQRLHEDVPEATDEQRDEATGEDHEATGVGVQASGGPAEGESRDRSEEVSAYVTPLVRKLAAQHGVDLNSIEGTGVGGRIRKQDVLDAAKKAEQPAEEAAPAATAEERPAAAPAGKSSQAVEALQAKRGSREKMSRLRKVIATRMVESLQTSAQLTTVVEVDVTKVARLRNRTKVDFEKREGVKLSFMPFFALAAIEALKEYPNVNASVEGDEIIYHAQENLGIAVDTDKGLIVPVIKDAGDLNIAGLARKIADVAERTRTNKIGPDELGGGTFTLTNTGSRGALFDTPIINQPQVGILGTGAVVKRPVVVADEDGGETIAIRSMVYLALTYDHRIVDGADAARFLSSMKTRLEDGSFEV
ncbi:2-oxoglutarate dehydrogenase, E2 component, dihydrolipoamide succinyltransferase [Ornithinicoccus halotolerans]|uniref:2-oxoglutarate dehydrogenase, E2 component, dihydrolipoamide succinyltransferase n=1 Tax=Ornithinicoccus halotolerans TaxID=1748220 RepID=UPI001296571E|nr:2-oxoglutarate dehydrogenase, E2 component, dihydrolipoamide succinyltransferase [Ornithinicoccus halotolerans]